MRNSYLTKLLAEERGNSVDIEQKIKERSTRWLHVFPDYYRVGMLNIGFQMAYFMLNSRDDVFCERGFLQENDSPLSLETQLRPPEFDVISFSLPFEMLYTNALKFLEDSGIEPFAERRNGPIVIAGGNGPISNPEPLADFFDALVIGDLEPTIYRVADALAKSYKKTDALHELANVPCVYVPSFYEPVYSNGIFAGLRRRNSGVPERIRKQSSGDIEFYTDFIVSPNTLWPDFYFLEINRGCVYNCKFCMLGKIYTNRFRSHGTVMQMAERARELTDKIRLVSSTEDTHPEIVRILNDLKGMGFQVIVGSQRADWISDDFASYIDNKTFTVAPESGSDRLRRAIGKNMTNEEIMDSVRTVKKDRLDELQLYLMVGLPNETPYDREEMARLIRTIRGTLDRGGYQHLRLGASINCFIPKPHTGFQYERQLTYDEYTSVINRVKELVDGMRGVEFTTMDEQSILVQGIVTRGDRRLGKVMYDAFKAGDNVAAWTSATYRNGLNMENLFGGRESHLVAPWSFIEIPTANVPVQYKAKLKGATYGGR